MSNSIAPIIVDLGKVKRKHTKRLLCGEGRLVDEVAEVIASVEAELGDQLEGKELLPIVILYGRKRKKKRFFSL